MSTRFSSTALFTAARICVLAAVGAAAGAATTGGGGAVGAMLASVDEKGSSFCASLSDLLSDAGAAHGAGIEHKVSSWAATETASCLTKRPSSLISPTTV